MIRGNLANGGAIVDLKLGGTGLHPGLQGLVRLENVEATLPFSRLEIAYGYLYFNPDDSLNPRIDLHGTSVIRDYTVHVYVYGTTLSPEAIFTSEPPLPQEEIISLLATGTTRQELTGNNNVFWRVARPCCSCNNFTGKFSRKGRERTAVLFSIGWMWILARSIRKPANKQRPRVLKLTRTSSLIGDLGVAGDFRGLVKYVIRFR